jgi:hypothetical protein
MTGAQSDIPVILPQIVNTVGDDDPFGQARKVMIKRLHGCLGIQDAWAVEIADQLFFSRMANLTREQYDSGYSRSALLRKGVKIGRTLLQNGP